MRTRCFLLVALLGAGPLTAQDGNALANLKTTYEAKRAELTAARDATVSQALAAYQAELATLLTNVKQQGNLDYVLAIEAEQKRLETGGSAPTEPASKEFAHLRRVQWATRQVEDKADAELAEQTGKLRKQYMSALEKLEKDLVAANRIEEAKATRAEREAVEAREAICGKWLWLSQYHRIVGPDGTIRDKGNEKPIGAWAFVGRGDSEERRFRIDLFGGTYVYVVTLSEDGDRLTWKDKENGKPLTAAREE